jgi:hypothetical protein
VSEEPPCIAHQHGWSQRSLSLVTKQDSARIRNSLIECLPVFAIVFISFLAKALHGMADIMRRITTLSTGPTLPRNEMVGSIRTGMILQTRIVINIVKRNKADEN